MESIESARERSRNEAKTAGERAAIDLFNSLWDQDLDGQAFAIGFAAGLGTKALSNNAGTALKKLLAIATATVDAADVCFRHNSKE